MNCEQIANKIYKILKNIEDKKLVKNFNLYRVNVWGTTKINIRYVDYHGYFALTKEQAIKYLKWLEFGNIGYHFDMEKET